MCITYFTCEWPPQASGHKNNQNMTIPTTTTPPPYMMTLIQMQLIPGASRTYGHYALYYHIRHSAAVGL